MSVNELVKMIGRTGFVYARGDIEMSVRVIDVKVSYGATRCLVEPVAGRGSTWVNADTIELD